MKSRIGHHFLLTPGPTNLPQPVIAAMARNSADISSADFVALTRTTIDDVRSVFNTTGRVFAYAANGHGAWEAALSNTLNPGDRVLVAVNGHFAMHWAQMADALGFDVQTIESDWREPIDRVALEAHLRDDTERRIQALMIVDTDTGTSVRNDIDALRTILDRCDHPALLLVDVVASLGCAEVDMDRWRADVVVGASQKGLMAPPGLSFVGVARSFFERPRTALSRLYWDWDRRDSEHWYHWFCGTAPTHLVFALRAALDLIHEHGLAAIIDRHRHLAAATREAVDAWGEAGQLAIYPRDRAFAANSVTTIWLTEPHDARAIKSMCYERFNVSLGGGLGPLDGRAFRIGHMGAVNEATLLGALGCVEAALALQGIAIGRSGVAAAAHYFATHQDAMNTR